jgi:alkanesulfonate monooxygenase SsuD/methylene tetrahydromethanopterin reductase-like flavin-dependent oxidoreductase (luciferase family)
MKDVRDHTLEMVKMADAAGFEIGWAAEHHAMEMTIAPNPFTMLTWWGDHTPTSGWVSAWSTQPTGTRSTWRAKQHFST